MSPVTVNGVPRLGVTPEKKSTVAAKLPTLLNEARHWLAANPTGAVLTAADTLVLVRGLTIVLQILVDVEIKSLGVGTASEATAGSIVTKDSTITDGTGNMEAGGYVQAGGAGVRITNSGEVVFLTTGGATFFSGTSAPTAGLGANGDFYFRTGAPSTADERIYVKSAGAWAGIL